jgi:hypothetical protein
MARHRGSPPTPPHQRIGRSATAAVTAQARWTAARDLCEDAAERPLAAGRASERPARARRARAWGACPVRFQVVRALSDRGRWLVVAAHHGPSPARCLPLWRSPSGRRRASWRSDHGPACVLLLRRHGASGHPGRSGSGHAQTAPRSLVGFGLLQPDERRMLPANGRLSAGSRTLRPNTPLVRPGRSVSPVLRPTAGFSADDRRVRDRRTPHRHAVAPTR